MLLKGQIYFILRDTLTPKTHLEHPVEHLMQRETETGKLPRRNSSFCEIQRCWARRGTKREGKQGVQQLKFRYSTIKCIKLMRHRNIQEEAAPFHEKNCAVERDVACTLQNETCQRDSLQAGHR